MSQSGDQFREEGNWYVLMAQLPPPEVELTLAPGITLRSLSSPLSVFDLAAAGAVGFREWAILEPVARLSGCEIESAKDAAITPGYDTLNRAWLASALLVLRGFTAHLPIACSAYSWNVIAGHSTRSQDVFRQQMEEEGVEAAVFEPRHDLPKFSGQVLEFHRRLLVDDTHRTDPVGSEDAEWICSHFDTFNQLASESPAFRLALEASIDWRHSKEPRAAIARLWSGIESLFGISSELVYRISLLTACLLEPRGERRKQRFESTKKLYGFRSKAIHGDKVDDAKLEVAMSESYHLLRDLILLCIELGTVPGSEDFDKAVFY